MTPSPHELWPIVYRLATTRIWPPYSEADITAFFGFANSQYLLPLLMADNDLPSQVAAAKSRFRALDAIYRKRHELSRNAALELQRVLGTDAFVFLKGADYRHHLYARPEFRPMMDIDVYMPSANVAAALKKLAAAGYPQRYSAHGDVFVPRYHEAKVEIGSVTVEIHRSYGQRVRAGIDYDGMWRRREWFERDGISGFRLSPADAIVSHGFHLAKDEFSSQLSRYVDFYLLLQQHQDELLECVARAKAWGVERPLFGALHVMSTLFPSARTPAVKEAINLLLNARTRRFLVDRVLPDPATEPGGQVTKIRMRLWRKFLLMDRAWRRLAFIAYHLYATVIGFAFEWCARKNGVFRSRSPSNASR